MRWRSAAARLTAIRTIRDSMNAWPHFWMRTSWAGKWKPFIAKLWNASQTPPGRTNWLAGICAASAARSLRSSQSTWSKYSPAPTWKCTSMNWSIPPQSAQPPTGRSTYTLISASRTTCSLSATYSTRTHAKRPSIVAPTVSYSASIGSMTITSGSYSFPPMETKNSGRPMRFARRRAIRRN